MFTHLFLEGIQVVSCIFDFFSQHPAPDRRDFRTSAFRCFNSLTTSEPTRPVPPMTSIFIWGFPCSGYDWEARRGRRSRPSPAPGPRTTPAWLVALRSSWSLIRSSGTHWHTLERIRSVRWRTSPTTLMPNLPPRGDSDASNWSFREPPKDLEHARQSTSLTRHPGTQIPQIEMSHGSPVEHTRLAQTPGGALVPNLVGSAPA